MLLDGLFLPLTTPFTPGGRLYSGKFTDNVVRYSKTPAAGLVLLSRTGQPGLLSDTETREAMGIVADVTVEEKVLIVGVARDSVVATLELIGYAAELGYDAALVPVPRILRPGLNRGANTKELLTFYRAVADRATLPLIIDSGLHEDGDIPLAMLAQLAEHPNILGMVDAAADLARISAHVEATATVRREVTVTALFSAVTGRMLRKSPPAEPMLVSAGALSGGGTALSVAPPLRSSLKTRVKTVGFQLLCGRTAGVLASLEAGASGAMPPLAAMAPQACYEVLAAWKDGDPALAAEKQDRLKSLAQRVEEELSVSGIKYGCDWNGYFGGRPRLPILPLTGSQREEIELLMHGIRN